MTTDSAPPDLPGYDFVRELGRGGFADVYLYRQHLPSREVAVKVLRDPARTATDRDQFENETNRMAMLSSHPGIVTIYEVGVAPDDRPFLTMEFCPHDHFGSIARAQPLTVARALEVGIKVAAAVETAHQASILHRDIKPANILLTTYGEPALTDFGIAGGGDGEEHAVTQGMSIPFAAPEVLNGTTTGDERSDVYSLGATVYALLAGRSPFSTGAPLSDSELIQRVLHSSLPPTGRADLPASLERVLATSLVRDPANRYDSAAAFGRALQGVEAELGLAQTPLRIADTSAVPPPPRADLDDDDSTRFRSLQRVDPDGPSAPAVTGVPPAGAGTSARSAAPGPGWSDGPAAPPAETGLGDRTVHRGPRAATADEPVPEPDVELAPPRDRRTLLTVLGVVVLVGVAALLVTRMGGGADEATDSSTTTVDTSPLVVTGTPARPEQVRVVAVEGGGQRITWRTRSAAEGDRYQVFFSQGPPELRGEATVVEEEELVVDADDRICVVVEAIRSGRVSDASTEVCSP